MLRRNGNRSCGRRECGRLTAGCPQRRGAALVELAICLPVLLLIVYGALEAAGMIFLRQALVQSSYEAAKIAAKSGDLNAAREAALNVAEGRKISELNIEFTPDTAQGLTRGTPLTVSVSAPGDQSSPLPLGLFRGLTVSAQTVMVKE